MSSVYVQNFIPCIFIIGKTRKHLIQLEYSKQTHTCVH